MAQELGKININNKADTTSTINSELVNEGAYYLADMPQYYEPQRSNTFKFIVTPSPKSL